MKMPGRGFWQRNPRTQVVPNKKAYNRKSNKIEFDIDCGCGYSICETCLCPTCRLEPECDHTDRYGAPICPVPGCKKYQPQSD